MQMERMFEIVYLLLDRKKLTAAQLAQRFGVSVRTIYRDIDALSAAGVPVYSGRGAGGGIQLMEGFVLNKMMLTEAEKRETLASLSALCAAEGKSGEALKKLSAFFGNDSSDWIAIDFGDWDPRGEMSERIELFKKAILERRVLSIEYAAVHSRERREIEPVKLVFLSTSWYILAWCRLRNDYRWFKLLRIASAEPTGEVFTQRTEPLPDYRMAFSDNAERARLKVRISPEMEYRMRDEFMIESYDKNADGSFDITFSMPKGEWMYQYLISYGDGLKVLAPDDVIAEMKVRLKKAYSQYL